MCRRHDAWRAWAMALSARDRRRPMSTRFVLVLFPKRALTTGQLPQIFSSAWVSRTAGARNVRGHRSGANLSTLRDRDLGWKRSGLCSPPASPSCTGDTDTAMATDGAPASFACPPEFAVPIKLVHAAPIPCPELLADSCTCVWGKQTRSGSWLAALLCTLAASAAVCSTGVQAREKCAEAPCRT